MLKTTRSEGALFASYLANLNATTDTWRRSKPREGFMADQTKIDSLIKKVGIENSWSEDQLKLVLTILIKNRIFSVRDLRSLSKENWARIELVPSVKELLAESINRGSYSRGSSIKRKITWMVNESNRGSLKLKENLNTFSSPPQPPPQRPPPPPPSTSEVNEKSPSRFLPPPNRKVDGNKLKVKTDDGKLYKVDRWCPRDKADLNARGFIVGSKLFCTKHNSSFDLEEGGIPTDNPEDTSINALPIGIKDW